MKQTLVIIIAEKRHWCLVQITPWPKEAGTIVKCMSWMSISKRR